VDVILGYLLYYTDQCNLLEGFNGLQDYVKRVTSRVHWTTSITPYQEEEGHGTLYFWWGSRSSRAHFLALEMGIPVNFRVVNLPKGEHKSDAFKFLCGDTSLVSPSSVPITSTKSLDFSLSSWPLYVNNTWTSFHAIQTISYFVEKYDTEGKFGGKKGSPEHTKLTEWGQYVDTTVDDCVLKILLHTSLLPEKSRNTNMVMENSEKFHSEIVPRIIEGLDGRLYFGGDQLSAIDCILATILYIADGIGLLQKHPLLQEYMGRLSHRECFKKSHIPPDSNK